MNCKVSIVIEKDDYGYYAYCPELEGCQTQGDSLEEIMANIKEAIELYLETLPQDERTRIPEQGNSDDIVRGTSCLLNFHD